MPGRPHPRAAHLPAAQPFASSPQRLALSVQLEQGRQQARGNG